jgi:uncharacterized protein (DUF4415 family)
MSKKSKPDHRPRTPMEAIRLARRGRLRMSDETDAAITAAALGDRDNPPLTDARVAQLRRRRGQRGPQKAPTKTRVTLRLDPDIVEHFKAGGGGWQSRINAALRKLIA